MPAMVAWSTVEVSGPNSSPCGAAAALRAACTTPGSHARPAPVRVHLKDAVQLEAVDRDPGPMACPATLEAAPRAEIGRPVSRATRAAAARSSGDPATSTTSGTTR